MLHRMKHSWSAPSVRRRRYGRFLSTKGGSPLRSAIRISIPSFLDYMSSTPRDCVSIVKGQRSIYLDPTSLGPHFYAPFRAAMRRAVNSVDPQAEIAAAVSNAWRAQLPHYLALQAGFEQWWAKARATGVPVGGAQWCEGGLEVKIRGALGLRHTDGGTEVVLPSLKNSALTAGAANLALRILERQMPQLLP